jgi:hypothetical protein
MLSASSQIRPARSHLARSWPSLLPTRLESVRNLLVYLRSGRRESNPHDQLGRLELYH